jgi:hypothetical protein
MGRRRQFLCRRSGAVCSRAAHCWHSEPTTTELLLTPKPELQSPAYGYGFSIDPARNIVGHGGGFSGIRSNLDIFRDSGYGAVVLSNCGRASEPVVAKLQELILTGTQPTTDV